jgi:hypothetical protein
MILTLADGRHREIGFQSARNEHMAAATDPRIRVGAVPKRKRERAMLLDSSAALAQ